VLTKEDTEFTDVELRGAVFAWTIGGFLRRACSVILVFTFETERGYQVRPCPDCDGSGIFLLPDNTECKCNTCKGSGRIYFNV